MRLNLPEKPHVDIGTRIAHLRRSRRLTQQQLARPSGLAVPYISRVENGHVQPSLKTLEKIAHALGIKLGNLLGEDKGSAFGTSCPVSHSGRCIAELVYQPGPRARLAAESYSPRQLHLLRLSNYLVQYGGEESLQALETVLQAFIRMPGTRRERSWLRKLDTVVRRKRK